MQYEQLKKEDQENPNINPLMNRRGEARRGEEQDHEQEREKKLVATGGEKGKMGTSFSKFHILDLRLCLPTSCTKDSCLWA